MGAITNRTEEIIQEREEWIASWIEDIAFEVKYGLTSETSTEALKDAFSYAIGWIWR